MFPHYSSLKTKQNKNPLVKTVLNCERQHTLFSFSLVIVFLLPLFIFWGGGGKEGWIKHPLSEDKKWGTPPPKEIGFLFRKALEWGLGKGGHESTGKRKKSLGGTWVKSTKWGFQRIPRKKTLPSYFKFYLWSRVRGASLQGCCFSPSSPTSVFFQLALGLTAIPLDPKQWNLAVPRVVLLCNIA